MPVCIALSRWRDRSLHAHGDRQTVERVIAADGYAAHDFVFADARGEPWRADGVTKYVWTLMLER
jgi:hypothetical protein